MQILKTVVASAIIAAGTAGTASAQEFEGPYVGAQAGWSGDDVRNPEMPQGVIAIDDKQQALTGGIYAGYDRRLGDRIVVGAEGSFDLTNDDKFRGTSASGAYLIDPKYSFDLTARAGYLVQPETLVYVRGGYSNARVTTRITDLAGTTSEAENRDGWVVGGGVERQLVNHVSARLEYRYSDLSEGDGKYDRHRVLAGLTYRF